MTFLPKPKVAHPSLPKNALGLTRRDYEGALSTLCAGCGHDSHHRRDCRGLLGLSTRAAEHREALGHRLLVQDHGVLRVAAATASTRCTAACPRSPWARTPRIAASPTSASPATATRLSIGLGQFCHAIRRNLNMLYIIENNGVYGLTKGQFSASADVGTKAKKGETNLQPPIDPVLLALTLGATFVARSFSGDKEQLVPLIQAGLQHKGFALIDVLSPCVTFNDHEGSTKSYAYTREHYEPPCMPTSCRSSGRSPRHYEAGEALPVVHARRQPDRAAQARRQL